MATIHTRIEQKRGCGYRRPGGTYLVADGLGMECGKLPVPLHVCPVCKHGIKPTRGFTWISAKLFAKAPCSTSSNCANCPMNIQSGKMGLLWVGSKFYPTARDFTNEARMIGVSKRIAQIPNGLILGHTWIAVAHRKCIPSVVKKKKSDKGEITMTPGIFHAFRPTRIEYVVKGDETEEQLNRLEKRGFTLVRVIRDIDAQTSIFNDTDE